MVLIFSLFQKKRKCMDKLVYISVCMHSSKSGNKILPSYKDRIICVDTETSGLKKTDTVIEIGAIEIINGKKSGNQFHAYIKNPLKLCTKAMKIHGITQNELRYNGLSIDIGLSNFFEFIKGPCKCNSCIKRNDKKIIHDTKIVFHNARFDIHKMKETMTYLNEYNKKYYNEFNYAFENYLKDNRIFCTYGYTKKKLRDLAKEYNIDCNKPVNNRCYSNMMIINGLNDNIYHSALNDANILADCLIELWNDNRK